MIDRAVDAGRLSPGSTPDEVAQRKEEKEPMDTARASALEPSDATVAPQHAHEDERQDGEATARHLGYDFQMLTRWIGSSGTW